MNEKGSRRKKILRVLAAALVFCVLFTYPNVPDILSVFAAGTQEDSVQADSAVQALLDSIAALPDSEEYLANEPDAEAEEAYAQWVEGLHQYAGEALDIQEAYDALTEEQQSQIPAEALTKLAVWVQTAMQIAEGSISTMATSGICGTDVRWNFDTSSGKLTISGNGAMRDFMTKVTQPWYSNASNIRSIEIGDGVTHIGDFAFTSCENFTSVTIPCSVTSIGTAVFEYCSALTTVTFLSSDNISDPPKPPELGNFCFHYSPCSENKQIYIPCYWKNARFTNNGWIGSDSSGGNGLVSVWPDGNHFDKATLQHIDLETIEGTAATCTETGLTEGEQCSVCGDVTKEQTVIAATGHTEVTIPAVEPTCTEKGKTEGKKCSVCGTVTTEPTEIDATGHTEVTIPAVEPTCTETGLTEGSKCSDCNKVFTAQTEIPATGHIEVTIPAVEPTCTEKGKTEEKKCSVCDTIIIAPTVIDAKGHTFSDEWLKDADNHWHAATCGHTSEKSGNAAHTWTDNGKTNPTVTMAGSKSSICSVCQHIKSEEIPILTNETVWKKTVDKYPTESGDGKYKYTSTTYGEVTVTVPALTNSAWSKTHEDPTEEKEGKDVYTSTLYGTVTVVLPKLPHTHEWGSWTLTTNPTITATGTAERVCTKDTTHKETKTDVPALSDSDIWEKAVSSTEPTVDNNGSYTYTSTDYGTVTVTVPKLTESPWEKAVVNDPTLETAGSYKYTSDYGEVTVTVPKLTDTTWTKGGFTTEPTISADGTYKFTNTVYGDVTVDVPKLTDPTWTKAGFNPEPTISADGTYKFTNTVYGDVSVTVPKLTDRSVWTKVDGECVAPTENTAGKDVYNSSEYGKVEVTIPKLEHTHSLTKVNSKPATETEAGVKEHWKCSGCGKLFSDANGTTEITDVTIPALGHTHSLTKVNGKPATETEAGVKEHWKCSGCGKLFSDANGTTEITDVTIPATGSTSDPGGSGGSGSSGGSGNSGRPSRPSHPQPDNGSITEEIQPGENAPGTKITTPLDELADIVLTSAEKAEVNDGTDITIILKIEDGTHLVPGSDKTKVETVIGGMQDYKLGQYLDVNLLKIIGGVREKITETNAPITVMFEIPEALRGEGREYAVIRVHDGETAILPDLDDDEKTVTIRTDKFSTYALAYSEKTDSNTSDESSEPSTDSSDPTSEGSEPADSGETSSGSGEGSSDSSTTSPSGESSSTSENSGESGTSPSTDENNSVPSESTPSGNTENPATGIAVSLIPLTLALAAMTVVTVKRKKK